MILSAVFLPSNSIPHVFGDNHKSITINFGGYNLFQCVEVGDFVDIETSTVNDKFVEGFFSEDVELISAIVGKNGSGKTSILRALSKGFTAKSLDCLYIFQERPHLFFVKQSSDSKIKFMHRHHLPIVQYQVDDFKFNTLFYSPILDYDLVDLNSPIAPVSNFTGSFLEYHISEIYKNFNLFTDPIVDQIREVYSDFPDYEKYIISVPRLSKTHFQETYILSNFSNPNTGEGVVNELDGRIRKLQDPSSNIPESFSRIEIIDDYNGIIGMLRKNQFSYLFKDIWSLEEYKTTGKDDKIHDGNNFIKNLEVTLISYLINGAVFPQTGLSSKGAFDFDDVLIDQTFLERLGNVWRMYSHNEYGVLADRWDKKFSYSQIMHLQEIKKDIELYDFSLVKKRSEYLKERLLADVMLFESILSFYNIFTSKEFKDKLSIDGGQVFINISESNKEIFHLISDSLKQLMDCVRNNPIKTSIIQIDPGKKLSSGEKAIAAFFSSLYDYLQSIKNKEHQLVEYFVLLLDEPEMGYHPAWKRKFVKAISLILPEMFNLIQSKKQNPDTKKYELVNEGIPKVQVIFTTHDPLTLSDIPQQNIVYLDKDEEGNTMINSKRVESFGANVHDLLADSFFLHEGFMGEFAEDKITDFIDFLTFDEKDKESAENKKPKQLWSDSEAQKFINIIDEPLIKERLQSLYNKKFLYDDKELLRMKIEQFTAQLNKLNNASD